MIPCRPFANILADAAARLGANVDRYSFIATDSHRLLLVFAGPSAQIIDYKGDMVGRLGTAFAIKLGDFAAF
jgi:hypothetical protein